MSQSLLIRFSIPQGQEQFLRSRLMSFQSPLHHWLRETGWGSYDQEEADKLEPCLTILGVKGSKLKRVKEKVELEAARNGLAVIFETEAR